MSRVTFGIVNYNRLFYLKSCAESLMKSVEGYEDVEFICIDDNSKETGTKEYLESLKERGWQVINQEEFREEKKNTTDAYNDTTHMDAFSGALNILLEKSTGDLFVPLQGDIQFVRKGWLEDYVELFESRQDIGCVGLDAQRKIRLMSGKYANPLKTENNRFAIDLSRMVSGAGDAVYRTSIVKDLEGWKLSENSDTTPEIDFTQRIHSNQAQLFSYVPWLPPAVLILTDPTGTNARIRAGKRYGDYWQAEQDEYYKWIEETDHDPHRPKSIEETAIPNGDWELPLDDNGNMLKAGNKIDMCNFEEIE